MNSVSAESNWTVNLKANGTFINFKSDPGAQANVLPEAVLLALKEKPQVLAGKRVKFRTYSGGFNPSKSV